MSDWVAMASLGLVIVPMLIGIGKTQGNVTSKLEDLNTKIDELKKLPSEVQNIREEQIRQGARLDALEGGRRRLDPRGKKPLRYYDRP